MKRFPILCTDCDGYRDYPEISARKDICDWCWDRRGWLVNAAQKHLITLDEVTEAQYAMSGLHPRRLTAEEYINELMAQAAGDFQI